MNCSDCGKPAEARRHRCRECRRAKGRLRPSRTSTRRGGRGPRAVIYLALAPEEWVAVWGAQGRACAICRVPLRNRYDPDSIGAAAFCDHSHLIEKERGLRPSIRGLLCLWCNRHVLVSVHDDPDKCQRAADYLRDPPAQRVIQCS